MDYLSYIGQLRGSFLSNKIFWDFESNTANILLRRSDDNEYMFRTDLHPHFFSGNPKEHRLIFILKNPMKRKVESENIETCVHNSEGMLTDFFQNQYSALEDFRPTHTSEFYDNCQKITKYMIESGIIIPNPLEVENDPNMTYRTLAQYSAIIDLIPLFGEKLKPFDNSKVFRFSIAHFSRILDFVIKNLDPRSITYLIIANSFLTTALIKNKNHEIINIMKEESHPIRDLENKGKIKGTIHKFSSPVKNLRIYGVSRIGGRLNSYVLREYVKCMYRKLKDELLLEG